MTIYYFYPEPFEPAGGVQIAYRHVDILNRAGLEAYMLHPNPPFRCTWFANDTPIRYLSTRPFVLPLRQVAKGMSKDLERHLGKLPRSAFRSLTNAAGWRTKPTLRLLPGDCIAISELIWLGGFALFPGAPRVVFNQNAYLTFRDWTADSDPYVSKDILGMMTVSSDSESYLQTAFSSWDLPILRVHNSVSAIFCDLNSNKDRILAYMPRKNPDDAHQVLSMLSLRGSLEDWTVVKIEDKTQEEVASILKRAAIFLSFGHPEGFGLPALEAMSAGCLVIGYHGMGGREFFHPEFSVPIEFGDIRAYAGAVESALRQYEREPNEFHALGKAAADFARQTYSPEREARDVVEAWTAFLRLERDQRRAVS
jgi:glycosyltransferase involved in cell wall biosynthesis